MLLATRPEVGREIERSRRRGRISDTIDVSEKEGRETRHASIHAI